MKKDIEQLKVENFAIAAVPNENDSNFWDIYAMNLYDETLTNIIIVASGYGEIENEARKSSTMRFFIEKIDGLDMEFIEPLSTALFDLTNEYWVSFVLDGQLYDKQYLFVPGSLDPINFIHIPFIEKSGVLLR